MRKLILGHYAENLHRSLFTPFRLTASLLFEFALSCDPRLSVQCTAVNITFLLPILADGATNAFLQLAPDKRVDH